MSCTRHFLNFTWGHHTWRPQVTLAETVSTSETDMWGRHNHETFVRCHKEEVCEVCGKTRGAQACLCDTPYGEQCAIRLAWLGQQQTGGGVKGPAPAR